MSNPTPPELDAQLSTMWRNLYKTIQGMIDQALFRTFGQQYAGGKLDGGAIGGTVPPAALPTLGASGASHQAGIAPDPGGVAGTARYLREDATWGTPSGSGTVTSVTGTAPVTVATGTSTPVITVPVFVASGASHATGLVPDPGAAAGSTKYLREDGTFAVPPGTGGTFITASAVLGADVAMTLANTYYDAVTVSLAAGRWYMVGFAQTIAPGVAHNHTAKLWDGTTNFASGMVAIGGNFAHTGVAAIVTPGSTTTYKLSVASSGTGDTIQAATTGNPAGNTATHLVAIKVG